MKIQLVGSNFTIDRIELCSVLRFLKGPNLDLYHKTSRQFCGLASIYTAVHFTVGALLSPRRVQFATGLGLLQ